MSISLPRYRIIQKMTPIGGVNSVVQPAIYAEGQYAVSGTPGDKKSSVVISSTAAEAHKISESILSTLGDSAPGIFVENNTSDEEINKILSKWYDLEDIPISFDDFTGYVKDTINRLNISSYTTSHRHVDALIRYSQDKETKSQVWSEESQIGKLIRNASNGIALAENFPNSALLGYWLSQRTPKPTKVARSVTSIVEGYGIEEVKTGSVKTDLLGNIPSDAPVSVKDGELIYGEKSGKVKPSVIGLGAIPGEVKVTGYRCEEILRRSTISAPALSVNLHGVSEEMRELLISLSIVGVLEENQGVYRTGADLITTDTIIESIDDRGKVKEVDIDYLLDKSMEIIESKKNLFKPRIYTEISNPMVQLIADKIHSSAKEKK